MNIPAFDTQKAVKAFTGAGFDDKQAETIVTTMNDVMSQNFATKADILALKSDMERLRSDLERLKSDLENSIEKVKYSLEQKIADKFETLYRHLWVMGIGIVVANVTLFATVVTLLQ